MCGRFGDFRSLQDLIGLFGVDPVYVPDDVRIRRPSWNVAPTTPVRVVVERPGAAREGLARPEPLRSIRLARWGLVPRWAQDPSVGVRMINARAETLTERPAFREALSVRRCLVPADGYYEWRATAGGKQAYWIHPEDGVATGAQATGAAGGVAFAGLYEFWRDPAGEWLPTCTVITAAAESGPPKLRAIHDRRPVVLPARVWDAWLDPSLTDPVAALAILATAPPAMVATPIGGAVGSVRNDGPGLLEPVEVAV